MVITSTIGGLQIFDEPRLYDQYGTGGADKQWLTLTIYIYKLGWGQRTSVERRPLAWLLFLIIVLIGVVNFFVTRRIAATDSGGRR